MASVIIFSDFGGPKDLLTSKKDVLFIIGDCNAKVGGQEIPGITNKFGRVQNEAEQM